MFVADNIPRPDKKNPKIVNFTWFEKKTTRTPI